MKNWSENYEYRAASLETPRSVDELRRTVAGHDRIRALGTRHSFTGIADTDGVLVTTTEIPPDFRLDLDRRVIEVGGGTRYGELAAHLTEAGWALHNMGSLPHISVAGAISTGTHGSGDLNGSLSSAVRGIRFVGPGGDLRWIRHGEPGFEGSVVALGLLGVIARVELAIEPNYLVRQDVYRGLAWDVLLEDVRAVSGAGYSVSVFTDWVSDPITDVWVKQRVGSGDDPVRDELFGATRDAEESAVIVESEDSQTQRGVAGAWSERLPHFRLDRAPSAGGDEIQTEYFVPLDRAADALRAVRALGDRIAPHLGITELRTVSADDLWLSPAYERDSMTIHFTFKHQQEEVLALCPLIEQALAPFDARPHWGKVNTLPPAAAAARYPRFDDFRRLVREADPAGKFGGFTTDALLAQG